MNFARRVFLVAGIYGVVVLVPQYFMEARVGRDFPPPITHPEFFYGFLGVALAWQILFFVIAHDPIRYRLAMWPSILEKVSFGVATLILFVQHRVAAPVLAGGLLDLVFAVLFYVSLRRTR